MLSENIWFTKCKPSNYSIFGEGKSDDGQTNGQTDRLNPFCGRSRVKIKKTQRETIIFVYSPPHAAVHLLAQI